MSYSIYLHIPFCNQRCSYCDFNTYAGMGSMIPEYVRALCAEIRCLAASTKERMSVHTVYFGGGTPSLLSIDQIEYIIKTLDLSFDLQPRLEVTLEANPGTLSLNHLQNMRNLGINRLSLGVQSAHPDELRLLERIHDYAEVIQSVQWARKAGFDNLNLDLIFGLPEQSLEAWKCSLNLSLNLEPEHFSLYALTLEEGTRLEQRVRQGLISEPDPDLAAEMYEWAGENLDQSGYVQYEISNWAIKQKKIHNTPFPPEELFTCRHNLQYWRNLPYLGFGAGAHGYVGKIRIVNVSSPITYIQRFPANGLQTKTIDHQPNELNWQNTKFPVTPATQEVQQIDRAAEMGETMMMGLRLTQEGVSKEVFHRRFGQTMQEVYGAEIERLTGLGLLEWAEKNQNILRLTLKGRLLGNRTFREFI